MRHAGWAAIVLIAVPVMAQAEPARIAGWKGGQATIKSDGPDGALVVGQIAADGTVSLKLPVPPVSSQTLGQTFPGCGGDGKLAATPPDAKFTPTSLYVERNGQELGAVHLATSPAVVAWRSSYAQKNAAEGAWFQWVHVAGTASVQGNCTDKVFTDADATESYSQTTQFTVSFKPGWNLLRNSIAELYADKSGKRHARRIVTDAVQERPEGASWIFVPY